VLRRGRHQRDSASLFDRYPSVLAIRVEDRQWAEMTDAQRSYLETLSERRAKNLTRRFQRQMPRSGSTNSANARRDSRRINARRLGGTDREAYPRPSVNCSTPAQTSGTCAAINLARSRTMLVAQFRGSAAKSKDQGKASPGERRPIRDSYEKACWPSRQSFDGSYEHV
jgi:hypothetical protein